MRFHVHCQSDNGHIGNLDTAPKAAVPCDVCNSPTDVYPITHEAGIFSHCDAPSCYWRTQCKRPECLLVDRALQNIQQNPGSFSDSFLMDQAAAVSRVQHRNALHSFLETTEEKNKYSILPSHLKRSWLSFEYERIEVPHKALVKVFEELVKIFAVTVMTLPSGPEKAGLAALTQTGVSLFGTARANIALKISRQRDLGTTRKLGSPFDSSHAGDIFRRENEAGFFVWNGFYLSFLIYPIPKQTDLQGLIRSLVLSLPPIPENQSGSLGEVFAHPLITQLLSFGDFEELSTPQPQYLPYHRMKRDVRMKVFFLKPQDPSCLFARFAERMYYKPPKSGDRLNKLGIQWASNLKDFLDPKNEKLTKLWKNSNNWPFLDYLFFNYVVYTHTLEKRASTQNDRFYAARFLILSKHFYIEHFLNNIVPLFKYSQEQECLTEEDAKDLSYNVMLDDFILTCAKISKKIEDSEKGKGNAASQIHSKKKSFTNHVTEKFEQELIQKLLLPSGIIAKIANTFPSVKKLLHSGFFSRSKTNPSKTVAEYIYAFIDNAKKGLNDAIAFAEIHLDSGAVQADSTENTRATDSLRRQNLSRALSSNTPLIEKRKIFYEFSDPPTVNIPDVPRSPAPNTTRELRSPTESTPLLSRSPRWPAKKEIEAFSKKPSHSGEFLAQGKLSGIGIAEIKTSVPHYSRANEQAKIPRTLADTIEDQLITGAAGLGIGEIEVWLENKLFKGTDTQELFSAFQMGYGYFRISASTLDFILAYYYREEGYLKSFIFPSSLQTGHPELYNALTPIMFGANLISLLIQIGLNEFKAYALNQMDKYVLDAVNDIVVPVSVKTALDDKFTNIMNPFEKICYKNALQLGFKFKRNFNSLDEHSKTFLFEKLGRVVRHLGENAPSPDELTKAKYNAHASLKHLKNFITESGQRNIHPQGTPDEFYNVNWKKWDTTKKFPEGALDKGILRNYAGKLAGARVFPDQYTYQAGINDVYRAVDRFIESYIEFFILKQKMDYYLYYLRVYQFCNEVLRAHFLLNILSFNPLPEDINAVDGALDMTKEEYKMFIEVLNFHRQEYELSDTTQSQAPTSASVFPRQPYLQGICPKCDNQGILGTPCAHCPQGSSSSSTSPKSYYSVPLS